MSNIVIVNSNPTALITGASSGIGKELAYKFAANKFNVVLVARTTAPMHELAQEITRIYGMAATVIQSDLSDPASPKNLYHDLKNRGIEIEVLVNNAGFGAGGPFGETSLEKHLELIQVNIAALTELSRLYLPEMLLRGRGRILNVASTAAFQPGPFLAVYYASKAYVLSLSGAIAEEVRGSGVTVTALCPGPTRTNFSRTATLNRSRLFNSPFTMTAEAVAEFGFRSTMDGKVVAIPGILNRVVAFSTRLVPRWVAARIAGMLQKHG